MTENHYKLLSLYEKIFENATPSSLCDGEILDSKIQLDAFFVKTGTENEDILEFIDELQALKLRYE